MITDPRLLDKKQDKQRGGHRGKSQRMVDTITKLDLERIGEHIIQPWEEDEFKPLLKYRGTYTLGGLKSLYNLFCAAMEMEVPTIGTLSTITKDNDYSTSEHDGVSRLAHLTGFHSIVQTPRLHSFGTRLLNYPEVMERTPHLREYLQFLKEQGGLRAVTLTLIRRYAPRTPDILINPIWPYIREDTPQDDMGMDLLQAVDALVNRSLPKEIREDACQDLMVALLEGKTTLANLPDSMPGILKANFQKFPMRYETGSLWRGGTASLDRVFGQDDERTLADLMPSHMGIEDSLCWGCEGSSNIYSDGLCEPCYIQVMNTAHKKEAIQEYFDHTPMPVHRSVSVNDAVIEMLAQEGKRPRERAGLTNHTKHTRRDRVLDTGVTQRQGARTKMPIDDKEYVYGSNVSGGGHSAEKANRTRSSRYQKRAVT